MDALKFCRHCGAQISANWQFCKTCGKPVTAEPTGAPPRPVIPTTERQCPNCGAALSATAMFCRTCGKPIELTGQAPPQPPSTPPAATLRQSTCPHCGAALSPTAKFCRECGKPVEPSAAPGPGVTPSAVPPIRQPLPAGNVPVAPPPTPKKKRGRFGSSLACGCLAILLFCVGIGVGGFVAYQRGDLTMEKILRLAGQLPPDVRAYNFREAAIDITITGPATAEGETPTSSTEVIKPLRYFAFSPNTTGRYRFDFGTTGNKGNLGTCTLTFNRGDRYRFVVEVDQILVLPGNKDNIPRAEAVVTTSSLCR